MSKGKRFGLVILICVCLLLCIGRDAYCGWSAIDPEVSRDPNDCDDDTFIEWWMTTTPDGLQAKGKMEPISIHYPWLKAQALTISSSRRIGYHWNSPPSSAEPQLFSLTWAGNISANMCTAAANKLTDYSKATELGFAKVTSADFGDGDSDKWTARSQKGAQCLANPPDANTGKHSLSLTISVTPGLPTKYTGTFQWELFAAGSSARVVPGQESSDTDVAGASSATFCHPGGSSNLTVDATTHQTATVTFELDCGLLGTIGGAAQAYAKTTSFTMTLD